MSVAFFIGRINDESYFWRIFSLKEEVKQNPWLRRINQFTGSNENLENQLLETYQTGDKNNTKVMKDEENFIKLAKHVAAFNYEIHINET